MSKSRHQPGGAALARDQGQISTYQLTLILFCIITSFSGTFVPSLLLQEAGADSWIAVVAAWLLDLLLAVVYAHMGLRFPGKSFVEYATSSLGRWVGKPVGFMFPLYFLFISALLLRAISAIMVSLYLPGTPPLAISIGAILVVAYGARGGLEVVARAAEVMSPIFVIVAVVVLAFAYNLAKPEYLPPLLESGIMPVLSAVPLVLSFVGICITMGMLQAYQDDPRKVWLAKFVALTTGCAIMIGTIVLAAAVLSPGAAADVRYPDLALARLVAIGEFFERLEALWVVVAIGASVLTMAILTWAGALGIAQTFGLKESRPLVFPLAGLLLPFSQVLGANQVELARFLKRHFPLYAITVEAGLAILIWAVALLRGRRGTGQHSPGANAPQ